MFLALLGTSQTKPWVGWLNIGMEQSQELYQRIMYVLAKSGHNFPLSSFKFEMYDLHTALISITNNNK